MKIYTKTGDGGETGLFGGRRVGKDDLRVAAYGEVDETNACLGRAVADLGASPLAEEVRAIQAELFVVGSDLATPPGDGKARIPRTSTGMVERLERGIDRLEGDVPELRNFILPGGTPAAASLQVARAVCRRAERAVVALSRVEEMNRTAVVYLNRLSDLLFVMARHENHRAGIEEPKWEGGAPPPPGGPTTGRGRPARR
jgi:cob(I)alamin adenosyltransferase